MKRNAHYFRALLVAVLGLALTACASSRGAREATTQIHEALSEGAQPSERATPPPEVSEALMPPININLPGANGEPVEQRFDVRVRRVAVRDFLLGLVEGTPYNVVVPPDLKGSVTLDLKNTTVPEVMAVLRKTYGYEFDRSGKTYTLLANQIYTRIFHVDYLDLKRTGQSGMLATPGQVSSAGRTGTNNTNTQNGQNQPQQTGSVSQSGSFSRVNTESVAEFWPDLRDSLRQIIGNGEGRSVTVNPQSGVVVVRGMPAELRAVEEFLNATQLVVQRQVILEARILEVELSDGFQSGINWAALGKSGSSTAVAGQFGGSTLFNSGASNLANTSGVLDPNNLPPVRDVVTTAFGGMFAMAIDTADFTAFIELLKTQGNVQVLSSPRVSTVNNQKAVIKVGADQFYVTSVQSSQTVTTTTTVPQLTVELTPFFSGVSLDVTPQISEEGRVILHVHPSVSEVTEVSKNVSAFGSALTLPTAASTIRESDSVIRASDGQIVVIGGLMQTRNQDQVAAVPLLSDIPLLGNLFKHTRQVQRKSELVILLKPIVVKSQQAWLDQLEKSSRTFRNLEEQ